MLTLEQHRGLGFDRHTVENPRTAISASEAKELMKDSRKGGKPSSLDRIKTQTLVFCDSTYRGL